MFKVRQGDGGMRKLLFIAFATILLVSCKDNGTPVTTSDK